MTGNDTAPDMRRALNDMEIHFEGAGHSYNQTYYDKLLTCFAKYGDEELVKSQNAAWKGMLSYYHSNGTSDDYMH